MTVGLSDVTKEGLVHVRPDREAIIGANAGGGGRPRRRKHTESVVPEPEFRSYYGLPVLNKPTWEPLDIAGYLFLGGLAGSSSTLAAAAELTGRPGPSACHWWPWSTTWAGPAASTTCCGSSSPAPR